MPRLVEGEYDRPTYCASFSVNPTVATDVIAIKAGPKKVIRIAAIIIDCPGTQTTADFVTVQGGFADALGSGGSDITPKNVAPGDGDGASTATVHVGDTTLASGFGAVADYHIFVSNNKNSYAPYTSATLTHVKHPTICDGVTNAQVLVIRHPGSAGAASFGGRVYWTEAPARD